MIRFMVIDQRVYVCIVLSIAAIVCSWITIGTQNWKWYIPTVLLSLAHFACAAFLVLSW